jgi:hypothetical protein
MQIYSESVFAKAAAELILASTVRARELIISGPPPQPSALISCLIRLLSIFALLMQHTHSRSRRASRGVDLFDLQKILQAGAHFSTLLRMIWPVLALAAQFMLLKIEPRAPAFHQFTTTTR